VTFKVFGIIGLTLAFGVAQVPLINRWKLPEEAAGS
jgi:intracellular septation protein A